MRILAILLIVKIVIIPICYAVDTNIIDEFISINLDYSRNASFEMTKNNSIILLNFTNKMFPELKINSNMSITSNYIDKIPNIIPSIYSADYEDIIATIKDITTRDSKAVIDKRTTILNAENYKLQVSYIKIQNDKITSRIKISCQNNEEYFHMSDVYIKKIYLNNNILIINYVTLTGSTGSSLIYIIKLKSTAEQAGGAEK